MYSSARLRCIGRAILSQHRTKLLTRPPRATGSQIESRLGECDASGQMHPRSPRRCSSRFARRSCQGTREDYIQAKGCSVISTNAAFVASVMPLAALSRTGSEPKKRMDPIWIFSVAKVPKVLIALRPRSIALGVRSSSAAAERQAYR